MTEILLDVYRVCQKKNYKSKFKSKRESDKFERREQNWLDGIEYLQVNYFKQKNRE